MAGVMKLTHQRLLELLDYDPASGHFHWKVRVSNRIKLGHFAGAIGSNGFRYISLDGDKFQANRLAWFYVNKEWPSGDIKPMDGNPDNCAIGNLKHLSRIEQARLRGIVSNNTSGMRGVSPTRRGLWKAAITCNYHQINLGVFSAKEEASTEYEWASAVVAKAHTPEECEVAAETIIQRRRKRVAWARLMRSDRPTAWSDFDTFARDIGSISEEQSTVAARDETQPVGPKNFRWLDRPQGAFDRTTKEGQAGYMKAYRDANPGRHRHSHLRKNYKIDEVEFHRMLLEQNGLCAICQKPETKTRGHASRRLSVDHDHTTHAVRGLLCGSCNEGLGYFCDDPEILRNAIAYIAKHSGKDNVVPLQIVNPLGFGA